MKAHRFTITYLDHGLENWEDSKIYTLMHDGADYGFIRQFIAETIAKDISFVGFPVQVQLLIEELAEDALPR